MSSRKWIVLIVFIDILNLNTFHVEAIFIQKPETNLSTGLVYTQKEVLNSSKELFGVLQWEIHQNDSVISFNLTKRVTATKLNIVLGLSTTNNVKGADLVNIKVNLQAPYKFEIVHCSSKNKNERMWSLDGVQNIQNDQNEEHIVLNFSRKISYCTDGNTKIKCIKNGMIYILWGSGDNLHPETQISETFVPDGYVKTYLTDPQVSAPSNDHKTWRVSRIHHIPETRKTSYWCNILKAPSLQSKHHIIGYVPYFVDSTSEEHVHHQLLYRCVTPPGLNATQIFEPLLDFSGEECYLEATHHLPSQFCTEMVYAWNRGGKPLYFPDNVGVPMGESNNEYYLMEVHYDNPEKLENLRVESGFDVLYSPKIRPGETSIILVGSGNFGLYMVPPNSVDFKMGGLCSSDCTKDMLTGVGGATSIIAVNLHAHMATHKMRLKHFRGNVELPSILIDDNYDASFQIMRHLDKSVIIKPGDQLGVECIMNTENRTILSGFSTRDEMCFAFLYIDKRLDYLYCSSEYPTEKTLTMFGIQKITWDKELQERVIKKANGHFDWEGRTLQSVLDREVGQWTENRRKNLEMEQMYGKHDSMCPPSRKMVRIAYKWHSKGIESDEMSGLDEFQRQMKMMVPNINTVSTPGFMNGECEWPKYDFGNVTKNGSSKFLGFDLTLMIFVISVIICLKV